MIHDRVPEYSEERQAILLVLIQEMLKVREWCGDKHLKMAIQFLQKVTKVPLGYNINFTGYSTEIFEPDDDLGSMLDYTITYKYNAPHGMDHRPTEQAAEFLEDHADVVALYEPAARLVAQHVGKWSFRDMEKNSTALFVQMVLPHGSRAEQIAEAMRLNTRLSKEEVIDGLDTLERMRREADALLARRSPLPAAG